MPDPQLTERDQGSNPCPHGYQLGSFTAEPQQELREWDPEAGEKGCRVWVEKDAVTSVTLEKKNFCNHVHWCIVCSGCSYQIPQTAGLSTTSLTVQEAEGCEQSQVFVKPFFQAAQRPPLHWALMGARVQTLSRPSLMRVLIPFARSPSLWPCHLLKAQPSHTTTLGIRFQHSDFGTE